MNRIHTVVTVWLKRDSQPESVTGPARAGALGGRIELTAAAVVQQEPAVRASRPAGDDSKVGVGASGGGLPTNVVDVLGGPDRMLLGWGPSLLAMTTYRRRIT